MLASEELETEDDVPECSDTTQNPPSTDSCNVKSNGTQDKSLGKVIETGDGAASSSESPSESSEEETEKVQVPFYKLVWTNISCVTLYWEYIYDCQKLILTGCFKMSFFSIDTQQNGKSF